MKSYTLQNWDGRLSTSDSPRNIQSSMNMAGSIAREGRSNLLGNHSENSMPMNDTPRSSNGAVPQTILPNYATTNVNSDGCNDGGKARLLGSAILENMSATGFAKTTQLTECSDASNGFQNGDRVFLPVENTLLHTFHAHVAPTSPELARQLEATLLFPPSPIQQKDIDVISLYTTDAEGSDEEVEDLAVVQRLLFSTTSLNTQGPSTPTRFEHSSPSSPGLRSSEPLFTPDPPSRKPSPKVRRERALYVDVPPLRGSKSDYKWLNSTVKKPRIRVPPVTYHNSLLDALQASVSANSYDSPIPTKKSKNTKEGVERKQLQNANTTFSKHLPPTDSISSVGRAVVPKNKVTKRLHKDDGASDEATKKQKRVHTRVDIDLTISDSEDLEARQRSNLNSYRPKSLPKPRKPVSASIKENDAPTTLTVGVVKPINYEIWALNIRHLKNSKQQEFGSSNSFSTNRAPTFRRTTSDLGKELPWFCKVPPQSSLDEEEISLGGKIRTSWDGTVNEVPANYSDDDEVIFVEPSSFQRQKSMLPPPFPRVSSTSASIPSQKKEQASRKIDLAAHYRRKEQSKIKPISPISASSTKSQGAFKSVTPSLLPNDATQPLVHSGPSVSPSHFVAGAITTVPLQVDENSQSNEAFGPTTPSAKALGKRKAIDSEADESYPTFRTFGFPSSYQVPTPLQSNSNNNDSSGTLEPFRKPIPDIFIHDYVRSPSPILQSSAAVQDEHTQMTPNFYIPNDELNHDLPPFGPSVEGLGDHDLYNWDLGVGSAEEYQFVDPSLLVGGPFIEPDAELSESMPDYATDFAPTDEDDDMANLPTPPIAGPSRIYDLSRRTSSSPSVLEFPSSTEASSERVYEPSDASSTRRSKPRKLSSTSEYVSSSDSDDEPLSKYMASKRRKRTIPIRSSIASDDDNMDVGDDDVPPKQKPRRSSSSSFVVSEDLQGIVYVPSSGSRSKAKKSFIIPDDTSSNDKEYVSFTKSSIQRKSLAGRKARRASQSSNDYDHGVDFSRNGHSLSVTPGIEVESGDIQPKDVPQSETQNVRILPKRQRTQRAQQDFMEIDEYFRTQGIDIGLPKARKSEATHKSAPKKEIARHMSTVQHREDIDFPKEDTASYCHQCRNKSSILKMVCTFCETKFCLRCLIYRYPDLTFFDGTEIVWTENCPRCGDFCNCTACCRKRGETYVPRARRGPFRKRSSSVSSTSTPIPALLLHPSVSSVAKVKLVLDPKSGVLPSNAQYFATMYDLNGRRMGATYAPTDNLSTIGIPVLDAIPPRTKTVFVGLIQRSWGFSKHAVIKDLKPLRRPKQSKSLQRRSKAQPQMRHFIGSDKFVKYRNKPEPYDPFGEPSSLSSLSSSDSEVEEKQQQNEYDVEPFNPHSLTEDDIRGAIRLGLLACGVTRIDGTGSMHTFTSL